MPSDEAIITTSGDGLSGLEVVEVHGNETGGIRLLAPEQDVRCQPIMRSSLRELAVVGDNDRLFVLFVHGELVIVRGGVTSEVGLDVVADALPGRLEFDDVGQHDLPVPALAVPGSHDGGVWPS